MILPPACAPPRHPQRPSRRPGDLLANYDCNDCVPPPALPGADSSRARFPRWFSQQQEVTPLLLPQLNRLYEVNSRGEDVSNVVVIPSSRLSTGSHSKSSHGGSRLKISSRHLRSHVAMNNFAFTRSNAYWPPSKTSPCVRKWVSSSLRKRMPQRG